MKPSPPAAAVLLTALSITLGQPLAAAPEAKPLGDQLAAAKAANDRAAQREIILRLLRESPDDAPLLRSLATLQLSAGEHERCAETLARLGAALAKPDAFLQELRGDLGRAIAKNDGERALAATHWGEAIKLEPDRASALHKLAVHHRARGEFAQEAIHLQKLLTLRDAPADRAALARHSVRVRDWDSLITHTAHLREHFANHSAAKHWSPMYDRLMKQAAPLAALDARLEEDPNSIGTLLERAWLFDAVGLDELSSDDARRALKLQPDSLALRYQHAVILAHGGKAYEAERDYGIRANQYRHNRRVPPKEFFPQLLEFEKRIARAPDAAAHAGRAGLLLDNGQPDLALTDAQAAAAIDPDLAAAHLVLARIHRQADHTRAAKGALRKVLQLEPENTAALSLLGYLQMDLGDFAAAAATFDRYLSIAKSNSIAIARRDCLASLQQ